MDFFGQQARARSNTRRLVTFFTLAVVLTNLSVYLALAGVFRLIYVFDSLSPRSAPDRAWFLKLVNRFAADGIWYWELFGWVTLAVLTVLAVGSGLKLWQLSRGGAAVAELLCGRRLDLNTTDPDERRLLNVVEEMAVASGLPVPDVYLLDEESGINAFAAGHEPADAVLGVTFGALKLLNRDELQGVVAHEFSHIFNGDMRLNMRLVGWLHGILGLVILGRVLTLNFARRSETSTGPAEDRGERPGPIFHPAFVPAFLAGWICIVAGSVGAFFARLVKSAINRQREYLADAAAVQFTRNPDGITGALVKIGGLRARSLMGAARAEEVSHMYFSDGMSRRWFGFTATHPPLVKRIQRLNPQFDGKYPAVSLERVLRESKITALYREHAEAGPLNFDKLASVIGAQAAAEEMLYSKAARDSATTPPVVTAQTISRPTGISPAHLAGATLLLGTIPETLRAAVCHPFEALALVYGMVCSKDPEIRARQLAGLAESGEPRIVSELNRLLPAVAGLEPGAFLPLADLCVRALRRLSATQYETFRANLQKLIEEDRQIDLFEYMLQRMIVRHLDPQFRPTKRPPVQYYTLQPLLPDCAVLLSGLAHVGHECEEEAQAAFQNGAAQLTPHADLRFLPLAECNLPQMDAAINQTAQASRQLKQRILDALAWAAATDGKLEQREAELLRTIADAYGMPIPPLLGLPQEAVSDA